MLLMRSDGGEKAATMSMAVGTAIRRVNRGDEGQSKGDFMILASPALLGSMTPQGAVGLIELWREARERGGGLVSQDPLRPATPPQHTDRALGCPLSTEGPLWTADPEHSAIEDDNAAACLARNALGGSRRGLFTGLVGFYGIFGPEPQALDLSVQVVFFDPPAAPAQRPRASRLSRWRQTAQRMLASSIYPLDMGD